MRTKNGALRVAVAVLLIVASCMLGIISVYAADAKQGWVTEDGVNRYYENGSFVTGEKKIGPHTYIFDDSGAYVGVTDGHTSIGVSGTMDTAAYKNALKGKTVLSSITLNKGETQASAVSKSGPWDLLNDPIAPNSSFYYFKQNGVSNGATLQAVIKTSTSWLEDRGNGNYAITYKDSTLSSNSDCYLNLNITSDTSLNPKGGNIVAEAEFKIGEDFCSNYTLGLMQFIYRQATTTDTNEKKPAFNTILTLKSGGYVYAPNFSTTQYLCKLTSDEYTRISVAIDYASNTFAVYVNGILVKDGIAYNRTDNYDLGKEQLTELRFLQFGSRAEYEGSVSVDNVYVYTGNAPVCVDTTTPARNGAYEEGSYLRYYKNNLILSGRQYITGTYFGQKFENELVIFTSGQAFIGNRATVKNGDELISDEIVDGNQFEFPSAVSMKGKSFTAWKVTEANGSAYLAYPGDKRMLSGDITVEAVGVDFAMLDGASVRMAGDASLRFVAKISKADYDALVSGGARLEAHILVAPTSYYDGLYGYHTLEALQGSGCDMSKVVDVKAESWFAQTDNYYYFTASTKSIEADAYLEKYSAVAYITIQNGGETELLYSAYSDEDNSRCVYEVAAAAYNDRVTEKGVDGYGTKVKYNGKATYSSYSKSNNENIKKMIDTVVTLDVDTNGFSDGGKYYELPYKLNAKMGALTYDVTVSGKLGSVNGLCVNGEVIPADKYTKTDSELKFTFDPQIQELYVESGEDGAESWLMTVIGEGSFTSNNVALPEPTEDGITDGFLWNYANQKSVTVSKESFGYDIYSGEARYNSYYDDGSRKNVWDLSDWETLKFKVYLPEEYKIATFYILFSSENDATDGSDYYGKSVTVYPGWNTIAFTKSSLGTNRTPLGWDKLTSVSFTAEGWSQSNTMKEKLYFTEIEAYDVAINENQVLASPELSNAAAFAVGGYGGIVNGEYYCSNPFDTQTKAFKDGDIYYIPANVLAIANDSYAMYFAGYGALQFELDGKLYTLTEGKKYTVEDESVALKYPAKVSGGAVYISTDDAKQMFGYTEEYIDIMGLVVISNEKDLFDHDKDYSRIADIIDECIYVRPTGEQIASDVMSYSGAKHPYLILNQNDFNSLNYFKKVDPTLQSYIAKIEASYGIGSSNYNADPVNYHITDGQRLLSISRSAMQRLVPWATLYKLYEKDKPQEAKQIAERMWEELVAINQFQDWHPSHYLDTGELAYPVAIAYDWLYDYWNADQRAIIEGMLYGFALKTTTALGGSYNLAGATNNWNGVTNGGIMTAALALVNVKTDVTWKANSTAKPGHGETAFTVKEYIDLDGGGKDTVVLQNVTKYTTSNEDLIEDVLTVLGTSITAIENGMWVYGPDGGYEEGPGYWSYGTTYTHLFISALDSACGTNYGVYEAPGFADSVYFTTYLGSMNTTWGFHDGGSGASDTSIAAWFAKKTGDGDINAIRRQAIDMGWKGLSIYDVIHFDPHTVTYSVTLKKDAYYSLDAIMTFRDSWDSRSSTFVGLHGGDNAASHGDLDVGNFVICVDGTYMICDLGADEYNMEGYFGDDRWNYYRKRAEGQNTLVMRPAGTSWNNTTGDSNNGKAGTPDQKTNAVSKVLRYESGDKSAIGVVDMTPAYDYMTEGIRGLYYTDDRSTIIVQDEATFSRSMDVWWFAHTQGEITISADGKTAIIQRNGLYLYAELVTDIKGAKFTAMDAVSLDANYKGDSVGHPDYSGYVENSRDGISKLCVTANNVTELKWAIVFKVISSPDLAPELGTTYNMTDIKNWKVD